MTEEQRIYLFGLLEKQFGKMSARERLIAGSIIDEAVNLATKQLQEQIEKMKNCKNCANYMISGKCPCFFRTGWCKNWKMQK